MRRWAAFRPAFGARKSSTIPDVQKPIGMSVNTGCSGCPSHFPFSRSPKGPFGEALADLAEEEVCGRIELAGALDLVEHRLGLHVLHFPGSSRSQTTEGY